MMDTTHLDHTEFIDLNHYQLWDFAGIDGLLAAKFLVGDIADRIAPWQSLETTWQDLPCSLLRLCEGNFRIGLHGGFVEFKQTMQQLQIDRRVWLKQCDYLKSIALPDAIGSDRLPQIAVPKLPHRLIGLQPNCAISARIDGISVLIWRHFLAEQPVFEVQTALGNWKAIASKLSQ